MTKIQLRNGDAEDWAQTNPTLSNGELGFENDTGKGKVGYGNQPWSELRYLGEGAAVDAEQVMDIVSNFLKQGIGISMAYNDAGNELTISNSAPTDIEAIQDMLGTFFLAGSGISLLYNDDLGKLVISNTGGTGGGSYSDEQVRDVVAAFLGNGLHDNISIVHHDDTDKLDIVLTDVVTEDNLVQNLNTALAATGGLQMEIAGNGYLTFSLENEQLLAHIKEMMKFGFGVSADPVDANFPNGPVMVKLNILEFHDIIDQFFGGGFNGGNNGFQMVYDEDQLPIGIQIDARIVRDIIGEMIGNGSHTGVSVIYDSTYGTLSLAATSGSGGDGEGFYLDPEEVRDIVGPMMRVESGDSSQFLTVAVNDTLNKVTFGIDDIKFPEAVFSSIMQAFAVVTNHEGITFELDEATGTIKAVVTGGGGGGFNPDEVIPKIKLGSPTDLDSSVTLKHDSAAGGLYTGESDLTRLPVPIGSEGATLADQGDPSVQYSVTVVDGVLYFDGHRVLLDTPDVQARMLPTDGENGMLLNRNTTSDAIGKWEVKDPLGKYRGAWAADEPLALYDFSTGVLSPFTPAYELAATQVPTVSAISTAPGNTPAYANMVYVPGSNQVTNGSSSGVEVDISSILNGHTSTRAKFFDALYRNTSNAGMAGVLTGNGIVKYTSPNTSTITNGTYLAWAERTANLGGATILRWKAQNTLSGAQTASRYALTGIRIYGTTKPYMFGDTVDYAGKLYRSEVNNNSDQPGPGVATWSAVTYP